MRVMTLQNVHDYHVRIWKQQTPEPAAWDLEAKEKLEEPSHGSLLLIMHQMGAGFGNLEVCPIPNKWDRGTVPVQIEIGMDLTSRLW